MKGHFFRVGAPANTWRRGPSACWAAGSSENEKKWKEEQEGGDAGQTKAFGRSIEPFISSVISVLGTGRQDGPSYGTSGPSRRQVLSIESRQLSPAVVRPAKRWRRPRRGIFANYCLCTGTYSHLVFGGPLIQNEKKKTYV